MKNKQKKELAVCGFETVKALAKKNPDKIRRFYCSAERIKSFGGLCKYLASKKIPYNKVEDFELERLCGSVHHQGVVAMIEEPVIPVVTEGIISQWVKKGENALLLDRVGNANNLGAIVRSAAFFEFKNIIIPADEKQSAITTSSYRTAPRKSIFKKNCLKLPTYGNIQTWVWKKNSESKGFRAIGGF